MRFCALSGGALVAASIVSGREMAKNEAQATGKTFRQYFEYDLSRNSN